MKRFLKHFRYGEKGFTLIELLVVIAILGVLAAVVVPNVSRFMGKGKAEAGLTELHSVQTAVTAMMADTGNVAITNSANNTATPVNNMAAFPSISVPAQTLFGGVHYLQKDTSEYWYTCDSDGTVRGFWEDDGTVGTGGEIGVDDPP